MGLWDYFISRYVPDWEYGTLDTGTRARRCRRCGRVEFLLWRKGEQGHKEDFWHVPGFGHTFVPDVK